MGLNSQKYRRATNLSLGGFGAQNTAGHSEVKLSHDGTRPKKPSFVSKDTETKGQLDNCQTSNFGHLLNYQLDSLVTPVVKLQNIHRWKFQGTLRALSVIHQFCLIRNWWKSSIK